MWPAVAWQFRRKSKRFSSTVRYGPEMRSTGDLQGVLFRELVGVFHWSAPGWRFDCVIRHGAGHLSLEYPARVLDVLGDVDKGCLGYAEVLCENIARSVREPVGDQERLVLREISVVKCKQKTRNPRPGPEWSAESRLGNSTGRLLRRRR
jgi:hypothetical protein